MKIFVQTAGNNFCSRETKFNKNFYKNDFNKCSLYLMLDTKTMAHIGGELVVIAGISFYFYRKTSALQEEIDNLKKQNMELIKAIEEIDSNMQQLYLMVRGVQPPPPVPVAEPLRTPPGGIKGAGGSRSSPKPGPPKKSAPKRKDRKLDPADTGDETLDEEMMDEMLKEDYKQMKKPPPKLGVSKVEECTDDVCTLLD
jgi:hypothetical protein